MINQSKLTVRLASVGLRDHVRLFNLKFAGPRVARLKIFIDETENVFSKFRDQF